MTWQLGSALVLTLALAIGFGWYERSRPPARVLALVAALAALAAIGRVAFAAFPNVKPTTDIVLFAGYTLGGPAGFAVGALAALVSNIFLGQGPWTPWQMASWGLVGLGGAVLGRLMRGREPGRLMLAVACGAAGFAFGALMDVYQWTLAAEHTVASYIAVSGTSLGFNVAHAAGNVVFALLIGPAFIRAMARYRRRFEVHWRDAAPALATALVALCIGGALGGAAAARAAAPPDVAPAIANGIRYLESSQNRDGGVGMARHEASDPYFASWAALGLGAAERNPRDVVRGSSVMEYLARHVRAVKATQDYERTILAVRVAGLSPRSFGGRDLVARLLRRQRPDGSFDRLTDRTAFGVLALRAAGLGRHSRQVRAAVRWLNGARNSDGGWGNAKGARSDTDNTAAVLNALGAAGRATGPVGDSAVRFLRRQQRRDGGFPLNRGGTSNSQSTSYAVMGLRAAGLGPREVRRAGGRTPIAFLKSMQAGDGSFRYNRDSAQTPVWVTSQVLIALEAKSLPLRPARRAPVSTARAASKPAGRKPGASGRPATRAGGTAASPRAPKKARRVASATGRASGAAPEGTSGPEGVLPGAPEPSEQPIATASGAADDNSAVADPLAPAAGAQTVNRDSGSLWAVVIAAAAALLAWFGLRRLPPFRTGRR